MSIPHRHLDGPHALDGRRSCYSAAPHAEQKRAPATFVCPQRGHAARVLRWGEPGGIFTVTLTGCCHPGTGIPSDAAMVAACMALNSRTRPGMKKHSMNPRTHGMGVQKKQR